MTATIRTSGLPANFQSKSHVQAHADSLQEETGVNSFGTYNGHSPPEGPTQAIDIFARGELRDRIAEASTRPQAMARFGIKYCINNRRIKSSVVSPGVWRSMADRGNDTANHVDHVHNTYFETAPGFSAGASPVPQGDLNLMPGQFETLLQAIGDSNKDSLKRESMTHIKLDQVTSQLGILGVILEAIKADEDGGIMVLTPEQASDIAKAVAAQVGKENAKLVVAELAKELAD